jgi:hypothetical protein
MHLTLWSICVQLPAILAFNVSNYSTICLGTIRHSTSSAKYLSHAAVTGYRESQGESSHPPRRNAIAGTAVCRASAPSQP